MALVIRDGQRSDDHPRPDMSDLGIDLDVLTAAERRDLANALLRAAWSAALEDVRVLLLDLLVQVDDAAVGGPG
jgi:hypothetical protein